jgi:hypothetical protein
MTGEREMRRGVGRGFGEFILLVVGVLLALSAENWLADRSDERLADSYLEDVAADLERDSIVYRIVDYTGSHRASSARFLLRALDSETNSLQPAQTLLALHRVSRAQRGLNSGSVTYVDLTSSGNLQLLPSEVRRSLIMYDLELRRAERASVPSADLFQDRALLPGYVPDAIRACLMECGERIFDVPEEHLLILADSLVEEMTPSERARLLGWKDVPGIEEALHGELSKALRFLRIWDRVRDRMLTTFEAANAAMER